MKLSAFGYIFNATLRDFDIEGAVDNFCSFFDELVLATINSEDDTRERLNKLEKKYVNFRVIESDLDISKSNDWDGKLKTIAMNHCSHPIRVIVDCDERIPVGQRPLWDKYAEMLVNSEVDGLLIPVIDLFKSELTIKANSPIGQKFRMHKTSIVERGVLREADYGNGFFDTSKTDSTDPKRADGSLGNFASIVNQIDLMPMFASNLVNYPYVLHYGTVDTARRAKLGEQFWKREWEKRSNRPENVITDKNLLDAELVIAHNLPI